MAQKQLNLIFAVKNGMTVHIEDVESGIKCGCVCPACGKPLVAKKGKKMMHHFAHHTGHNCEYGYESSLHLAAKEILLETKRMVLPPVYVSFPDSGKEDELIYPAKEIQIEKVELERRFGDVIPDVVVYAGGKHFFVEIYVTHCIDDKKLVKLKQANISTLEIDLSHRDNTTSIEELKELLLYENEEKKWKYNSVSEHYLQKFYSIAEKKRIVSRGAALHVDYCPKRARVWRKKSYANYRHDCFDCEYCISVSKDKELLCTGKQRISTINDFKIPESQRVKEWTQKSITHVDAAPTLDLCPRCGGELVKREGKNGPFLGCKFYPFCKFTASIDINTGEVIIKERAHNL